MKKRSYLLSVFFTAALTLVLLGCVIARLVYPMVILPQWNIPNLVALSAVVLVLEHYVVGESKKNYLALFLFSALSSGLLPWAVGYILPLEMGKYALSGGMIFAATAWLFESMEKRLSTGPAAKAAPVLGALGLYLAAQALHGIFL